MTPSHTAIFADTCCGRCGRMAWCWQSSSRCSRWRTHHHAEPAALLTRPACSPPASPGTKMAFTGGEIQHSLFFYWKWDTICFFTGIYWRGHTIIFTCFYWRWDTTLFFTGSEIQFVFLLAFTGGDIQLFLLAFTGGEIQHNFFFIGFYWRWVTICFLLDVRYNRICFYLLLLEVRYNFFTGGEVQHNLFFTGGEIQHN